MRNKDGRDAPVFVPIIPPPAADETASAAIAEGEI
jgi:hypothetical protein